MGCSIPAVSDLLCLEDVFNLNVSDKLNPTMKPPE